MGAGGLFFADAAKILRARFPDKKIPKLEMPDWLVRLYALVDRDVRDNIGELGHLKVLDSADAERLIGHALITPEDAILATAESLVREGLV